MRIVFVRCVCESCGKEECVKAIYNEMHDGFEDCLPEGWECVDNVDYQWLDFSGDQCPACQEHFREYIKMCCVSWKERMKINISQKEFSQRAVNDDV